MVLGWLVGISFTLGIISEALAELGESLHQLLTGLEDLGVDSLPPEVENEMRRAMSLSPHPSNILDTDSLASSLTSQFGTPYGLSPAEEVAFSTMIQHMMAGGEGVGDPMLQHMLNTATDHDMENDPVIQHIIAGATEHMMAGQSWEDMEWGREGEAEM